MGSDVRPTAQQRRANFSRATGFSLSNIKKLRDFTRSPENVSPDSGTTWEHSRAMFRNKDRQYSNLHHTYTVSQYNHGTAITRWKETVQLADQHQYSVHLLTYLQGCKEAGTKAQTRRYVCSLIWTTRKFQGPDLQNILRFILRLP